MLNTKKAYHADFIKLQKNEKNILKVFNFVCRLILIAMGFTDFNLHVDNY